MTPPRLFHDPTSEPCRAVHWFAVEAGIELEIEYIWLTRGEHRSPRSLAVNPGHQVPALQHGTLCLAEASAIMVYLAEINGVVDLWTGRTPEERDRAETSGAHFDAHNDLPQPIVGGGRLCSASAVIRRCKGRSCRAYHPSADKGAPVKSVRTLDH